MTNAMIIELNKLELQKQGILKYTGRTVHGLNLAGEEVELPEIQPIHTFNGWKSRGFRVKRGEHAIAKFPIWKYTGKRKNETEEEAQEKGYCFMKLSAFFTDEQVEKIDD